MVLICLCFLLLVMIVGKSNMSYPLYLTSICFRLYSLIIVSFLRVLLNCSYDSLIVGSDRLVENS